MVPWLTRCKVYQKTLTPNWKSLSTKESTSKSQKKRTHMSTALIAITIMIMATLTPPKELFRWLNTTKAQEKFVLRVQRSKFTILEPCQMARFSIQATSEGSLLTSRSVQVKSLEVGTRVSPNSRRAKKLSSSVHLITPTARAALVALSPLTRLCTSRLSLSTGRND